MPEIEIKITIPEGSSITVNGLEVGGAQSDLGLADRVETYWRNYLSDNGRKIFGAAARLQDHRGPGFTLEEIAHNLSVDYESARSWHRTAGRSAKRWRKERSSEEPIKLIWIQYAHDEASDGMRTRYRLDEEVSDVINALGL